MNTKFPAVLLAVAVAAVAAPGKLILNGKTIPLTHVYARKAPDKFEPKLTAVYVLAVDRELPPDVRADSDAIRDLQWEEKLNGVEIQFRDGGINWSIFAAELRGAPSGSRSPNPYTLAVDGGRVRGTVKMEEPSKLGDLEYYYEFSADAPIEVKVAPPPPTAADRAAAVTSAPAKAYMALQTALMKGDKAAIMKAVDPAKAAAIDTPEFPQMLKMIQSMQPKNIQVLRAKETGDAAVLDLSGNGGAEAGVIKLQKIDGNWIVMKESWKKKN
ncbi:MAG: hypothetical protein JNM66_27890 [Bryobacterales bacterium]|nr:hypothetical protein [Bryobacterales bacterium]